MSQKQTERELSFKDYFFPFTTVKAIHFIFLLGFVVYGNALVNGFVWDDFGNILMNPQVQTFSLENIFGNKLINIGLQYRPIVTFYFSLMYFLFADAPFFYHLFNIVFHIINSILVLLLLRKFFALHVSFFLSLIFLIHPMQVESATWISTAGNFYFLFGITALLLGMKKRITWGQSIGIGCLLLLSLLSKETGIVFILIVLLYSLLNKKNVYQTLIIGISVTVVYTFMRFGIAQLSFEAPASVVPIAALSLEQRLLNVPVIIAYYFQTFVYPLNLAVMQYWVINEINLQNFYLPLLMQVITCIGMLGFGIVLYKKYTATFRVYAFFVIWFILGLLLHIHISPLNMTVADRWFYFPMVGLLGLLGLLYSYINPKMKNNKILLNGVVFVCITVIVLFSIRTMYRNADWRDDLTLYLHDRQIHTNFNMENNIGWNYQQQKKWQEANKYYRNSVELNSQYAISLNNLADSYLILGKKEQAKTYYFQVLQAKDYYPVLYERDLSYTSSMLNKNYPPEVAKEFIQKALNHSPNNSLLLTHLAIAEYKLKNFSEALVLIEKARRLSQSPDIQYIYTIIRDKKSLSEIKY